MVSLHRPSELERNMTLQHLRTKYASEILSIAQRHGASNLRVFGSVARGDAGADSDVDLLVHLGQRSLLDLGGLLMDLRNCFSAASTSSRMVAYDRECGPRLAGSGRVMRMIVNALDIVELSQNRGEGHRSQRTV
jgi:predicted nucleotidyltransferase